MSKEGERMNDTRKSGGQTRPAIKTRLSKRDEIKLRILTADEQELLRIVKAIEVVMGTTGNERV